MAWNYLHVAFFGDLNVVHESSAGRFWMELGLDLAVARTNR